MFEARFVSATLLKRLLDAIKELVQDVNFLCTEEGIELQSMDASHVALINVTVLAEACSLYSCSEPTTLGINVGSFVKILKCAEPSDSVRLEHTEGSDSLNVHFESVSGARNASYSMRLMDIDGERMEIPEVAYDCSVTLPSAEFSRIIKDMATFGSSVSINVSEEACIITTKGDMGTATVTLKEEKTSKTPTLIECAKKTSLMFPLQYLVAFTKAQSLSEQVGIFLSDGIPIHISFDMGDKGSVGYHLAPKIMED
jgi:proliferating cell nuclear antigen